MAREAVDEGSQRRLAGAPTAAGVRPGGDSRTHLLIGIVLPASAVLAAVAATLAAAGIAADLYSTGVGASLIAVLVALGVLTLWAWRLARQATAERADVEQDLRQERFLLELLLSHSPDQIYFKDRESRFIRMSASVARRLSLDDPAQAIGKTDFDFFAPEHAARARAQEIELMTTGEPLIGIEEHEIWLSRGEDTWVETTKVPLRDADGNIVGLVGVNRDISERKRAEAERALLEAQRLESLALLAGGVAHDFNNLLVGVLGNASLALSELPPSSAARETIEQIVVAGQRAAELANEMLAFSGKGKFVLQPIDLSELVRETAHLLQSVISKDATLSLDGLTPGLPSIDGDETQIRQIVMNLITNASDALGDRPGIVSVRTCEAELHRTALADYQFADELEEGLYVLLQVSDSGEGMSPETRGRIFDPFFTTKFTGRGLGLAALLGIVRGHGGALKVESELGRGSTFTIVFPASGATQERVQPAPESEQPASAGTILVADDEEIVRVVTTRMLEQAGFAILLAEDGDQALELYRAHADEITAVLLDLTMPARDGAEVFAELRRLGADVPVILSSGYTEQQIAETVAGKEAAGFIQKPYTAVELVAKVQQALAQSSELREAGLR